MAINSSRYRLIKFYGGRILQSREVAQLQRIQEGLDTTGVIRTSYDLDAVYRDGAILNVYASATNGTVSFSRVDQSKPMLVFIRGRWEPFDSSDVPTLLTIPATGGNIYVNWSLQQITSAQDPTLVDTNTGQPTADMGQLVLNISTTDTSGVALASNQFEKNTTPVLMFTFINSTTSTPLSNVVPAALANQYTAGYTSLTTNTSAGTAASSDDSRLSDPRTPLDGSVVDTKVRIPNAYSPASSNPSDGTPVYNLATDPGGISSAKIIHQQGTQLVSDLLEWFKGRLASFAAVLTSHIGQRLGSAATHPMPSATDVGATPQSHVGQPLGLPTSHPPVVSTSSGGFQVNRSPTVVAAANDPAYGVFSNGTPLNALYHNGDIFSSSGTPVIVNPIGTPTKGPLNLFSVLAKVVAEHVNQTSHANPHGLAPSDIGAATTGYVDTNVANVLAQSKAYTNTAAATIQAEIANLLAGSGYQHLPNGLLLQWKIGTTTRTGRGAYGEAWPIAFPNECFLAVVGVRFDVPVTVNWQGVAIYNINSSSRDTISLYSDVRSDGNPQGPFRAVIIGIGY